MPDPPARSPAGAPTQTVRPRGRAVLEVALLFLRLGVTAFGGPAAYIAMMRDEVVDRRRWLDDQQFLDLLGTTNLIPGPNASEMSMHLGLVRARWAGFLAGGIGFLLPGMLITLALAWTYTRYGTTPAAGWLLYGVKPVIIPLILLALWRLGQKAITGRLTGLVAATALALSLARVNFVGLLVGGGLLAMLTANRDRLRRVLPVTPLPLGLAAGAGGSTPGLGPVFLAFLKIGALLYGSGYVLFAFLQAELVEQRGWLTEPVLIDAIAFGQMTPGPLATSATFVGYVLAGVPGALVATAGLFLPAFVIVAVSHPFIPRLRESRWAGAFLDGVNAAALGLMAAVTWELARAAFVDAFAVVIGLAAVALLRLRIGSGWLVLFGAAAGLASRLVA